MPDPALRYLRISPGDTVTVHYCDGRVMTAVVASVPEQTGAMWILQDLGDGEEIVYQNPMSTNLDCIRMKP